MDSGSFHCAHVHSHRKIKRIATRKQYYIMEYNVTLKDDVPTLVAPTNMIHTYQVWIKGVSTVSSPYKQVFQSLT